MEIICLSCKYCGNTIELDSNYCSHCGRENKFKIYDQAIYSFYKYSPSSEDSKDKALQKEMAYALEKLERENKLNHSLTSLYSLACGYSLYYRWYPGPEKSEKYIQKIFYYFEKILEISSDEDPAKIELAILLIRTGSIGDIERGINYLEEVKSKDKLPFYSELILLKSRRKIGNIPLRNNLNFKYFNPTPAIFTEERKNYRYLVKKFINENDIENTKKALLEFYNLAFLSTLCYPNYDFDLGVTGELYEKATKIVEFYGDLLDYSFEKNGYLDNCKYLSNRDYKIFIKIYGDTKIHTDPLKIK